METETEAVNIAEVVHVLRLARDGWPKGSDWSTYGFAAAVWHGFLAGHGDEPVTLTGKGEEFLAKFGPLYREAS